MCRDCSDSRERVIAATVQAKHALSDLFIAISAEIPACKELPPGLDTFKISHELLFIEAFNAVQYREKSFQEKGWAPTLADDDLKDVLDRWISGFCGSGKR